MYQELYTIITARLTELGFVNVGSALADSPPLPACQVYLSEDTAVVDTPAPTRQISWAVKLAVAGAAAGPAGLHDYLDTIRQGFSHWRPAAVSAGMLLPFSVPRVRIHDHRDHGTTEYLIFIETRINTTSFAVVPPSP